MINKKLLDVLRCPKCLSGLENKDMFLLCKSSSLAYPVLGDNIPDMLIGDAWTLEKAKKNKFMHSIIK